VAAKLKLPIKPLRKALVAMLEDRKRSRRRPPET
jgi:hypothetical protein